MKRLFSLFIILVFATVAFAAPVQQRHLALLSGVSGFSGSTWNPDDKAIDITLSNENLTANRNTGGGTFQCVRSTDGKDTGKRYVEFTIDVLNGGSAVEIGVMDGASSLLIEPGNRATGWGLKNNGTKQHNGAQTGGYSAAWSQSDVLMMAYDLDNSKIWWGLNGVWSSSGDPAAGTNAAYSDLSGTVYPVFSGLVNFNNTVTVNFGASAFAHIPPTGFAP